MSQCLKSSTVRKPSRNSPVPKMNLKQSPLQPLRSITDILHKNEMIPNDSIYVTKFLKLILSPNEKEFKKLKGPMTNHKISQYELCDYDP